MEAISFGIPVLATDVGGTSEIVSGDTGWLIEKDFSVLSVVKVIESNRPRFRDEVFRLGVRGFWKSNFEALKNYKEFINQFEI